MKTQSILDYKTKISTINFSDYNANTNQDSVEVDRLSVTSHLNWCLSSFKNN